MQLFVEQLKGWTNPSDAFVALFANLENCFWLDREFANPGNRFSVIGSGKSVKVDSIQELSGHLLPSGSYEFPFDFNTGLVGFVDFEAVNLKFLRVDSAIVFDHENRHIYLLARSASKAKFTRWLDAALLRLGLIGGEVLKFLGENSDHLFESLATRNSDDEYLALIERSKHHIANGDVYQLCLTNQISVTAKVNPLVVYMKLRRQNPAPYSSFIRIGETTLVCSSPESFLRIEADGRVVTKPIKGTRPRGETEEQDQNLRQQLTNDVKERAENLMIVDLMRNDLLKVCAPDSVTVEKLYDVESFATVHQLVSTVSGVLRDGESAVTALDACFPGGSMTGAPKERAIQLIQELEGQPRGVYSGVNGFVSDSGTADLGMTIRSLVFEKGQITVGVGGGITIDSDPASELLETKIKAMALLKAVQEP